MTLALQEAPTEAIDILGPLDEPGITFTTTGLKIELWVDYDQWLQYGRKLQLADKGIQWALGDWMVHGEKRFKEMAYQAVEFTGLKLKTLQNYATVANAIEKSRRRDSDQVDFATHAEVASLPDEHQDALLDQAASDPTITRKEIRRAAHRIKRDLGKEKTELEVVHAKDVQEFLAEYMESLKDFEGRVPVTARFLRMMIQSHIAQAHWQMNRTVADDCEAIMLPVEKYGSVGEDDLYTWLMEHGYFMSDPEFEERTEYMMRDDVRMLSKTDAGRDGKQDDRRGKLPQIYVRWFKDWKTHYEKYKQRDDEDAA